LLAEGDVAEILARGARETFRVRVPDPARAAQLLGAAGFAVQPGPDVTLVVTPPARPDGGAARPFDAAAITEVLARQEIFVSELVPQRADLEQVFLALTAEEHLGAAGPPPPQSPPEVLATSARPSGAPGADR
jgi:ABC-2 type transport system ATP-binding protein